MDNDFQEQLKFTAIKCGFAINAKSILYNVPPDSYKWIVPIPLPVALACVSPPIDVYPENNYGQEVITLDWKVMIDGWGTYRIGFGPNANILIYRRSEII